jgi:hypothetical protein
MDTIDELALVTIPDGIERDWRLSLDRDGRHHLGTVMTTAAGGWMGTRRDGSYTDHATAQEAADAILAHEAIAAAEAELEAEVRAEILRRREAAVAS